MSEIEKNISQFIENQFPAIYREEGELFVEFVTRYYEWMEQSNNVLYHSRNLLDYKDIDATVEDFVVKFKQKYLNDIQLDTAAKTRNLVKHSLDLYRSKGTERSIDVFFRAVFGVPAEIYYPGNDIFRLSDGKWVQPKYIEVTDSDYNVSFVGKQVQGVNSKATAFVERYIKRKIKSKYIHIFYISAINGDFETGELISLPNENLKNIPTMIGSMTTLDVITGGADFAIGDIVTLTSNSGLQGKARVTDISNISGTISYELVDSGWGYTTNAEVLISEKVLTLSNVQASANLADFQFKFFETIKQPLANVTVINANNTFAPVNNDLLFTYYSNGTLAGKGLVLGYTANGSTNGELYVAELYNTLGRVVEPSANLAGTVSLSSVDTALSGISITNVTSQTVNGVGTSYTLDLVPGQVIKFFAYNANNDLIGSEDRIVQSIANDTNITLTTNASFTSSNVILQTIGSRAVVGTGTAFNTDFVYGDTVAFYSNSSNYILDTVNAVVNATYMTLQNGVTFSNNAANYADAAYNSKIYTSSNAISANINTHNDKSATANVMGMADNQTLKLVNCSSAFSNTEYIYQLNSDNNEIANAKIVTISINGANATITTDNTVGVFVVNGSNPIMTRYANGISSSRSANLVQLDMLVGVISVGNTFIVNDNNFIYGTKSFSNATLARVSTGALADFSVSNTLSYPESLVFNSELIDQYANMTLNSTSFGFPKYPSANISTQYLDDIFKSATVTIGGITSLVNINPGKNYDAAPFVTIYEPMIAAYGLQDFEIDISNTAGGLFAVGEVAYQTTGGQGIVKSSNASHVSLKRLTFGNIFDPAYALIGLTTGVTANIVAVSETTNIKQIGLNAIVSANVQTSQGSVSSMSIADSGFGYLQDEIATFTSSDGERSGSAKVNLGKHGFSEGFFKNKNGHVSGNKKIFDGEYYQEFSYEIRSPIRVDKYAEMLKNVMHVAGTKAFSAIVMTDIANSSINVTTEIVTE